MGRALQLVSLSGGEPGAPRARRGSGRADSICCGCRTLEEAASVPVVYTTAYYALLVRGRMRRGETVLIHSGSGGVGQAAITIALSLGCRVFTTVGELAGPSWSPRRPRGPASPSASSAACTSAPPGSAEKRAYLQARFPQLDDTSFANSRDTSFEQHVLRHTAGKGAWPAGAQRPSDPHPHPHVHAPSPTPSRSGWGHGPGQGQALAL